MPPETVAETFSSGRYSNPRRFEIPMVPSGKAVVRKLFGVEPTSGYRSSNNPLTKKNPGSWHNKGSASHNGAVDMPPIKGMTFEQAAHRIEAAGYVLLEARDEVNYPTAHATGPHWHFVIGTN